MRIVCIENLKFLCYEKLNFDAELKTSLVKEKLLIIALSPFPNYLNYRNIVLITETVNKKLLFQICPEE